MIKKHAEIVVIAVTDLPLTRCTTLLRVSYYEISLGLEVRFIYFLDRREFDNFFAVSDLIVFGDNCFVASRKRKPTEAQAPKKENRRCLLVESECAVGLAVLCMLLYECFIVAAIIITIARKSDQYDGTDYERI